MRPLNVIDLRDTHEIGGPGKTIVETFRFVDHDRFRLHLGVFLRDDEGSDTPFLNAARAVGLPVHEIRSVHQYDPRLIFRTAALLDRLDIDIVHSHEVKSDAITYLASPRRRVAKVTTLHGWIGNTAKQRVQVSIDRKLVRSFDRVIAVSGRIREQLVEAGVPEAKLRLIHNAIVLDNYRPTGERGHVERLIGRPPAAPILVTVGRLSAEKGHADLVEALRIVAAQTRQFTMIIAGDGPERPRLTEAIRAHGLGDNVFLVGYVDQPKRLLEEAQLMVLPSHTEGLPNAVLESLRMGVPVLATRVGGTPEVIDDGLTGRLIPAHAPAEMAKGILDFMRDPAPWRAMAERGGAMVAARFDFKARTRCLESVYEELRPELQ